MTSPNNSPASVELLPCPNPWCGSHDYPDGAPNAEHDIWEYQPWYRVQCPSCPIRGPHAESKAKAITAWNTRTPSPSSSQGKTVVSEARSELYAVLSDLMENPQYQVAIGGNPNMVDALLDRARAALSTTRGGAK